MNFVVVFKKLVPKNLGKLDNDATLKNEKQIINMAKKCFLKNLPRFITKTFAKKMKGCMHKWVDQFGSRNPICALSYSKELLVVELKYHQFFIALTHVFSKKIKKLVGMPMVHNDVIIKKGTKTSSCACIMILDV
jgi:hypothetical protein